MIAHDDAFLDAVALLALGTLPETEARRVAAHLASCAQCRALYAELRPAADLVGYAAETPVLDEVTSARMKARLMQAVRADESRFATAGRRRPPALGWFAAAAALLVAGLIGSDDLSVRARNERGSLAARSQLAALQRERAADQSRLLALVAPGSRHFSVPQGEVVTSRGRVFVALKLAALPHGKVYQAWTLAKGAKAVTPSSTFSPDPSGVAIVELPVDAAGVAAVAVSVEPLGGSKAPTSTPKFIRTLS